MKRIKDNCKYNFKELQNIVPLALDSVSLPLMRRFWRKSMRYIDAYRRGLSVEQAEYAVKKYKSHRRLPLIME